MILLAAMALAVTQPTLTPGEGVLFACFFPAPDLEFSAENLVGLGVFIPSTVSNQRFDKVGMRDPDNLINGGSFDLVRVGKSKFRFTGDAELTLWTKGGPMYQALFKTASNGGRFGVCQAGPAGDRDNALEFFDALAAGMKDVPDGASE